MSDSSTIPVFDPSGNVRLIPQEQYAAAINAGGVPAVKMADPSGTPRYIPRDKVADATRAGGKLLEDPSQHATQFEANGGQAPQEPKGAVHRFTSNFNNTVVGTDNPADVPTGLATAVAHPSRLLDSLKNMASGAGDAQQQAIDSAYTMQHSPGVMNKIGGVARGMEAAIPLVGPALMNAGDKMAAGDVAGGSGTLAGIAAPLVAAHPSTASALSDVAGRVSVPSLKGALANRMAEVPAGEQFSRQQVLEAAKDHGVNLDLAQATDSGPVKAIKKANQYSLTGQGSYEANTKSNLSALEDWANKEASTYSKTPAGKEVVGGKMQAALQDHVNRLQTSATQIFNGLDRNVGNITPDATAIYDKAKQIVDENADYYDKNPALKQSRSWQIVNDLANRAEQTQPTTHTVTSKLVDESGRPITKQVTRGPEVAPDSWADLQKLRTDLMNEYRSPDIAGSRAEGWLKQLTGTIDQSMTGAGSGLTGAELTKFRQANAIWESLKSTYDNPQSPLYHALRAQAPSQVPGMLSKGTPELARQVRDTLGSLEGPFQRQFVENLLYAKDGQTLELGKLNQKLKGVSSEHLEAMIGPEGAKNLRMLGKVAQKVTADANPSGTAKVGQPAAELAGVFTHPVAVVPELGAQYVGARAMNSSKVVDYLTRPLPKSSGH